MVRVAPNTLSFVTPQSYRDIYGHANQGKKRFLKNNWFELDVPRINTVRDPAVHTEQRKTLSHAFSARALRDQEIVIHRYVSLLLEQIGKIGLNGEKSVNVTAAWNWLTFDIIGNYTYFLLSLTSTQSARCVVFRGSHVLQPPTWQARLDEIEPPTELHRTGDLSYGEPFGCLAEGTSHWVDIIFDYFQYSTARLYVKNLGALGRICLRCLFPKNMIQNHNEHLRLHKAKARRRIARGSMDRIDFFDHLIKNNTLTEDLLLANADLLLLAGSETTATALTGLTWYLLHNPACLATLTAEVRGAFTSEGQITGDSTAGGSLPYLHGCVEEAMRLFPPVTLGLPRDCPGAVVDGVYVPEGVVVSTENYAMARDPRNWADALAFRPERWVGDGNGEGGLFAGDDRGASQPFSAGPRACLGINLAYLEMRVTLARVMWAYDLELVSDIEDWNGACVDYMLWKKPELLVKFHPRVMV